MTRHFRITRLLAEALLLSTSGCVWIFREVDVRKVGRSTQPVFVESPVRVHLVSGRSVVTESDLEGPVAAWHELWAEIERTVIPELWAKVEMLSS